MVLGGSAAQAVVWHRTRASSHHAKWRDTNEDAAELMVGVLVNGWEECRGQLQRVSDLVLAAQNTPHHKPPHDVILEKDFAGIPKGSKLGGLSNPVHPWQKN
jgi:hypothetical protein